jgi:uncharacterized protein DUF6228
VDAILRTAPSSPTFGSLRFGRSAHAGGGDFKCRATVEANSQSYEVGLEMIDAYREKMLDFFEDLGRTAGPGWAGEKRWRSEFAELRISAASVGGDVNLDLEMRWPPNYDNGWDGTLRVEAQALEQFADSIREFLR